MVRVLGVPRVSGAHLAARRQQILDAAARCFVRNGFHQTSMQDVIKEAGLSAGAFYRFSGLVQGWILQRILLGGLDRQIYMNGVRALPG